MTAPAPGPYEDFLLAVGERAPDGSFPLLVSGCGGETRLSIQVAEKLLTVGRHLQEPETTLPVRDAAAIGRALATLLLPEPARALLVRSARVAAEREARLRLVLDLAPDELATLPWEWMTSASGEWRPAVRDDYTLVRVVPGRPPPAALPVNLPLRILVLIGADDPACDINAELQAFYDQLRPLVRSATVEIETTEPRGLRDLRQALRRHRPHVLHVVGVVDRDPAGQPAILLDAWLDAATLSPLLAEAAELRLGVVQGGGVTPGALGGAAPAFAAALVRHGLCAAVAPQGGLSPADGARFAVALYRQIAAGDLPDSAVTAARQALDRDGTVAWGMPVLVIDPDAGMLFRPFRRPPVMALAATALVLVALVMLVLLLRSMLGDPVRPTAMLAPGGGSGTALLRAGEPPAVAPRTATLGNLPPAEVLPPPTPMPTPAATPTPLPTPLPPPPEPTGYVTTLAAAGESLAAVAARTGSDTAALAALNRLPPDAPLWPGQPLVVPVFSPAGPGTSGIDLRRGNPARPVVALTFDIEIDDTSLYQILGILQERQVRATFFVTGNWVRVYPAAARAIVEQGHEIGNHSLTHPFFSLIGPDGALHELSETERLVREHTGASTRPLFRFPYGDGPPAMRTLVASQGYLAAHWSADDAAVSGFLVAAAADPASAYGGILLLHQRPQSIALLPDLIDRLRAAGLEPAPLGEVLR